ncbi:MAG: hypothetical protein COV67_09055, partial [Nitrospinae bacterium CG11_big_fil_rev_8_21_14_0_20_56_8]
MRGGNMADTFTTNFVLTKPEAGKTGWTLNINDALDFLDQVGACHQGAGEPAATAPYMFWADTSAGFLKMRNAADDGWIALWALADGPFGGIVSMPAQPSFLAHLTGNQSNVTGDGTDYDITGAIWTEVADVGGDFLDGTFTAPVSGTYVLSASIEFLGVTSAHTTGDYRIVTSNANIKIFNGNFYQAADASGKLTTSGALVVYMDASDTAFLRVRISSGAKVCTATTS